MQVAEILFNFMVYLKLACVGSPQTFSAHQIKKAIEGKTKLKNEKK
jgi:hypothetical protein